MDRVHRFPEALSRVLAEKYLPASVTDLLFLLRIYLGKVVRSTGFINTRKFPVDSERYEYLRRTTELTLPEFPPPFLPSEKSLDTWDKLLLKYISALDMTRAISSLFAAEMGGPRHAFILLILIR